MLRFPITELIELMFLTTTEGVRIHSTHVLRDCEVRIYSKVYLILWLCLKSRKNVTIC